MPCCLSSVSFFHTLRMVVYVRGRGQVRFQECCLLNLTRSSCQSCHLFGFRAVVLFLYRSWPTKVLLVAGGNGEVSVQVGCFVTATWHVHRATAVLDNSC